MQTQHKEELDIRDNRGGQAGGGGYGGPGQAPAVQMIQTGSLSYETYLQPMPRASCTMWPPYITLILHVVEGPALVE